jgi:putative glutamine amidotransferase
MQIANVLLGGTLIEDIRHRLGTEHALPHHQVKDSGLAPTVYAHEITITSGTVLREFVGAERVAINSFHHQAIGKVAPALYVTGRADDGVIEAVELAKPLEDSGYFLGVQWHPEWLPEDPTTHRIYAHLVRTCTPTMQRCKVMANTRDSRMCDA